VAGAPSQTPPWADAVELALHALAHGRISGPVGHVAGVVDDAGPRHQPDLAQPLQRLRDVLVDAAAVHSGMAARLRLVDTLPCSISYQRNRPPVGTVTSARCSRYRASSARCRAPVFVSGLDSFGRLLAVFVAFQRLLKRTRFL
jgi:hypothetical protein